MDKNIASIIRAPPDKIGNAVDSSGANGIGTKGFNAFNIMINPK